MALHSPEKMALCGLVATNVKSENTGRCHGDDHVFILRLSVGLCGEGHPRGAGPVIRVNGPFLCP